MRGAYLLLHNLRPLLCGSGEEGKMPSLLAPLLLAGEGTNHTPFTNLNSLGNGPCTLSWWNRTLLA